LHQLHWSRRLFIGVASIAIVFSAVVPALALDGPITVAAATTGKISGSVRSTTGTPVAGATVTVKGPAEATATTDAAGGFTLVIAPGIYSLAVSKGGYQGASLGEIVVAAGQSAPVSISLAEIDLSTLRTIGSVTSGSRSTAINAGAATETFVSAQQFANLANPEINDVLQRIPDVVIQKMGTQADTSIVVGGLQPYETQVLIDGHPVALGQYGVWFSQYFPSYLIGGAESESGPGNTTPFANIAVAGTVNLTTPAFTTKKTAQYTTGWDNYGSLYSNLTASGSVGNFKYVAAAGTAGSNGYYFGKSECDVFQSDYSGPLPGQPGSAGIVPFCGNFDGSFHSRGMLGKVEYDFSPATSLGLTFIGTYGGYSPQGSAWGESYGPTTIEQCLPGQQVCTAPSLANLVGKTINGFYWFPGTDIQNTQQLYAAQLRTSFGANTIVDRPYVGALQPETYVGQGEGGYPAFFGLTPGSPGYQAPTFGPGVQIPANFAPGYGGPGPNNFETTYCPSGTGNLNAFSQLNSPNNTIGTQNGAEICYQYPYSTYEQDKLFGNTLSLIHPFGDSFVNLTYDFHGSSTFAYANAPQNYQVPQGSATRFDTFSLTGSLNYVRNLTVSFGLYDTRWTAIGQAAITDSSGTVTGYTGLDRSVSRFDPHLAFTFRPLANTSYRAAVGTSETFPFIADLSGPASNQPPAFQYTAGLVSEKNPHMLPEFSLAFDAGVDHRLSRFALLSADLQDTVVHNVFQALTLSKTVPYLGGTGILGIFTPINVARLEAKLATIKYSYAPPAGLGFNVSATADRSIFSGIPAAVYNPNPGLPANDVQVCGGAGFTPGLATCIPYLKGYGQFTYTKGGTYAALGVDYEGKNNAYYQPPFAILDLTARRAITQQIEFQLSVQNLLNTNSFNYLPGANQGVPAVGDLSTDGVTIQQGSYSTYLIPAATRTLRLQLRAHLGS